MQTSSFKFPPKRTQKNTPIQKDESSAFTTLLIRYMDGRIADRSWKQIMKTFDQGGLSGTERMAFARFMTEIIDDTPTVDLHVPNPAETEELMSQIRA